MANYTVCGDAVAFHPGYYLQEWLEGTHSSIIHLANLLKLTIEETQEILAGKRGITPDLAARLEAATGVSKEYWLNLQDQYDMIIHENEVDNPTWLIH